MPEKQKEKFSNIFDYLNWRGDLDFSTVEICEVDALIFSILSYIDYSDVVPTTIYGVRKPPALLTVTKRYLKAHSGGDIPTLGLMLSRDIVKLLARASKTKRFGLISPLCFVNRVCDEEEKQFSAIAFALDNGDTFVAFRGTDDTLVGWKENFNMSFMYPVPAQSEAVKFLEEVAARTQGRIYLGGHSKGGNLAVYAGVKSSRLTRERIERIYSNDAPGFDKAFIEGSDYRSMADRISTFLPQSSVVGMLLEHEESYTVIKSKSSGLLQHDGLSWEVLGGQFIRAEGLSNAGKRNDTVIRDRIAAMSLSERQDFIRLMFQLLESTGAKTLTELHHGRIKAAFNALKAFREMPEADQETASYLWDKLVGNRNSEIMPSMRAKGQSKPTQKSKGRIRISFFPLLLP